jgi:hypothetical protein
MSKLLGECGRGIERDPHDQGLNMYFGLEQPD